MTPPEPIEDDTPDPAKLELQRRSHNPAVAVWVILALILIGGAAIYVLSAL
jgi:hypothetical protein